jgi:hypothetical protein
MTNRAQRQASPQKRPVTSRSLLSGNGLREKTKNLSARLLSYRHKNNKIWYYSKNFLANLLPDCMFRTCLQYRLTHYTGIDVAAVQDRLNYYNRIESPFPLPATAQHLTDLKLTKKQKTYYFDTRRYTRYFSPSLQLQALFGDIVRVPQVPSLVKSRPITTDNHNSVLFKLNRLRHFVFTDDRQDFRTKKDMLVGRGAVRVPHRVSFYDLYFHHPLCDLGQTNLTGNQQWQKPWMSIAEQLRYKFILSIEGNDVASNLKWIMSSQSLAVMTRPKYETWFMEGRLLPNVHYVEIRDDYSDLEEKLEYYITHPQDALRIIRAANEYVSRFRNAKTESILSLLVLEKYFAKTGQIEYRPNPFFA